MAVQANELSPNMIVNWLVPNIGQSLITRATSDRLSSVCLQVTTDGYSNQVTIEHKLNINAADLAAGYPLVEIYNPATNPIPASTGATHTTLTGAPALLGVTVLSEFVESDYIGVLDAKRGSRGDVSDAVEQESGYADPELRMRSGDW